jgi:hypothetical protein
MQPTSKKSQSTKRKSKAKKPIPVKPDEQDRSSKGRGLTIPEQVARARKRLGLVQADIAETKKRLVALEGQLVEAQKQLKNAENLPRRSALGRALVEALQSPNTP